MPRKLNQAQTGNFVEIGRLQYSNLTTTKVSLSFPAYKYIRVVNKTVQSDTNTTSAAVRIQFNSDTSAAYDRKYTRWTNAGAPNILNSTETSIIMGLTGSQYQQTQCIIEGVGNGSFGWGRFLWQMWGDTTDWSYGFGQVSYNSSSAITSLQVYVDVHTVSGEIIVYGHN